MSKYVLLGLTFPILLFSESLDDLIKMSLVNKNIEASKMSNESIKKEYDSVKKGYLPSLSVGGAYTDVAHETASAANNSLNAYVDLSYSLYDGGKKDLTYKTYKSRINSSSEDLISLKNNVTLDVIDHYFNYLTNKAAKEAKNTEIEQLNAQFDRLSKFLDAGTTTSDEVDRIVSNMEKANVELQEIELNIQTILHELEYITGQRVTISDGSFIEIKNEEATLRNDIKSLKHSVQTQLLNAKNVKTTNKPQVNLDNKYTYYDHNYNSDTYADQALRDQNVFAVNVEWKLFDFNSNKTAYDAAYKSFLSAKSKYEYEKNRADVDLSLAKKSYDINKLKIKSAEASLKAAISTYDVTKNKYENGLVNNVSYLEALSDKSEAQSALWAVKNALEISKANLIYQNGKNVWEYVK
ncbi:TolC family protein [Poseidonibacter lekithochrous]|uniref:TolC family protein n=1 Tax=Poseidonibacter TaxID=2321187 RepID=UPI001C0A0B47|nr:MULTISPECIES: TolC family protein [Poseidonibacter]MBU3014947.1 TolC family protein [Poseidonibacter lekithochrous]MDO6828245.1 TolC family protein [Poseidonibacter sp. 1_MG-2023]